MNRRSSDRIAAREILWVSLLAVVLALVSHWPLPLHLDDAFSRDLGDPIVQAWQVAWGGHALLAQPTEFFQAPAASAPEGRSCPFTTPILSAGGHSFFKW